MIKSLLNNKALVIAAICVITFICFRYTLNNQFTNWDDDYYVTNDPYIKALTPHNLKVIFTEDITKNNYHPFCMLSLAINYYFAQLNPTTYYLTNILIHIINVLLVFFLFLQLCRKLKVEENMGLFVAAIGSLWFGVHPMHVESVAWIAERKDVLYGMFYIMGLITYIKFLNSAEKKWYWLTFLLFVFSCLSKPMAVVFPMSLLCFDFLFGRELSKKLVIEKIIFFGTSLLFGLMAFYTQNKTGAVAAFGVLTLQERFMYAAYGFVMYVSKFFNPTYLSTFYPYPFRYMNVDNPDQPGYLHTIFYASPFIALAILLVPSVIAYKRKSKYFRVIVFGTGFLIVNLIFVLQFISVGAAIMADRYSYVAYIGLIFLVVYLLQELFVNRPNYRNGIIGAVLIFSIGLSYLCYHRTYAWHDARALLSDAIEKYPFKKEPGNTYDKKNSGIAMLSYKWLGNYYFDRGQFDSALDNYNILVTLRSADEKVEGKIARINMIKSGGGDMMQQGMGQAADPNTPQGANPAMGQMMSAMPQGQLPKGDFKLYLDSSYAYLRAGDSLKAFRCYIMAFRFNPGVEKLYAESSFSAVQNKQYDDAIKQYGILLKLNTGNPYYYFYRGVAQFSKNNLKSAIADWETAMKTNTKEMQVQQSASYNLCVAYDTLGKDSLAWYYVQKARQVGYKVNDDFYAKLKRKWDNHKR